MMKMALDIRKAIKKAMLQAGISQADLIRSTGINKSYFSAWMNGRGNSISVDKLERIASGIGIKTSYLVLLAENLDKE
jgi:transcriptional regulator with XRE-family HTH domain